MNKKVFVGGGSNLDNRPAALSRAIQMIKTIPMTRVVKISSLYETEPVGGPDQRPFLNCVLEISTSLSPRALLKELLAIERRLGRTRRVKWGPRSVDLDLLAFDSRRLSTSSL